MILVIRSTYNSQMRIVYECKSIWISLQKHDKIAERILSRVLVPIKSPTFMKNVSS